MLSYCLMGKLLNTMAGVVANDFGRCGTRYCGEALQRAKVMEMVPRFFGVNKTVYFGQGFIFSQFLVATAKAPGMEPAKLIK